MDCLLFRGTSYRQSAHTIDEKAARKLLKQRLKQVERPGFVGSKEDMWTLAAGENCGILRAQTETFAKDGSVLF